MIYPLAKAPGVWLRLGRDGQAAGDRRGVMLNGGTMTGPIAVDATAAAVLFGMSKRTWLRMNAEKQIPAPRQIRGAIRWDVAELRAWSAADCPVRSKWSWGGTTGTKRRRRR